MRWSIGRPAHAALFRPPASHDVYKINIGQPLKDDRELAAMKPAERQEYQDREIAKLRRLWKGDYLERLEDARRLVREVEAEQPGVLDWLEVTGLANSTAVVAQIGELSRRKYGNG
jgi:hypothetical protein